MFRAKEILKVTKGKLVSGDLKSSISGISTDTRTITKGDLFIAIKGKNFDGHNFVAEALKKGACGAIVQPIARSPCHIAKDGFVLIQVKDTSEAFGDIAHHYRMGFDIPFIGITGSNGKTTTKEIIFKILSSRSNALKNEGTENNLIGLSQTLLRLNSRHDIGVLELGTNHFGEIKSLAQILKPSIGVITNIGPAHLEFLESREGVLKEKTELLNSLNKRGTALLNADDALLGKIKKLRCRVMKFGIDKECDFKATRILQQGNETNIIVNNRYEFKSKLLGRHNIYNALAAIAAGLLCKIGYDDIRKALLDFETINGRGRLKRINGIDIIDDTYNSNPGSLKTTIDMLSSYETLGKKILVCGDMLELGSSSAEFHREAAGGISNAGIDYLISVGKFSDVVREAAVLNGMQREAAISCRDNHAVLDTLKKIINEGDVIALKGSRLMKLDEVIDALSSFISVKRDMVRI